MRKSNETYNDHLAIIIELGNFNEVQSALREFLDYTSLSEIKSSKDNHEFLTIHEGRITKPPLEVISMLRKLCNKGHIHSLTLRMERNEDRYSIMYGNELLGRKTLLKNIKETNNENAEVINNKLFTIYAYKKTSQFENPSQFRVEIKPCEGESFSISCNITISNELMSIECGRLPQIVLAYAESELDANKLIATFENELRKTGYQLVKIEELHDNITSLMKKRKL